MNGSELLWSGGERRGSLDISLAAEDLELNRLSLLLFPTLGAEGALAFASSLLTEDEASLRMRQEATEELLAHPALAEALKRLLDMQEEMDACYRGLRDNPVGQRVTKMDAAMDGVKKAVLRLERNLSQQGADILEENAADNRYAQLLRFTHFRKRLTVLYAQAIRLLEDALGDTDWKSAPLRTLKNWAHTCFERDRIPQTLEELDRLDAEWQGVSAFAVDVCLDSRRMVVGLEVAETRPEPYARRGMLDAAGTREDREGVTALMNFPQNSSGTLFQEYLLSQVGYEVRSRLTRLRDALGKLPATGVEELLSLREAFRFYTGAADFGKKLLDKGSAVTAPRLTENAVCRFRAARLPEQTCTGSLPVANDLSLETGGSILMTGPNSSGKTCCLIMIGQFFFLGQLGCLLPAEDAEFSPRDRLLTLFAAGESETGEDSRMGLEVQRIRLLQSLMTDRSILFFNEPMTSTSAREGAQICTDLLADLARRGIPALLVTHFNHMWPGLEAAFSALGLSHKLHSLVMTVETTPEGLHYLYRLEEAPPPPSSHARAVVAEKGLLLEDMLSGLNARGLDMRPADPGWERIRRGVL